MNGLPQFWKLQMERRAATHFAVHLNLAGVFLNNAVAYREAETCPTSLALNNSGFGGEERIVDAAQIFCRDAGPGIADDHLDLSVVDGFNAQYATLGHGVFGVQKQVQKYLLQFSHVAQDVWQLRLQRQV